MISRRERTFWQRLGAAADAQILASPDLFRDAEVADRRRHHLTLVIRRKAVQLGVVSMELDGLDEARLEAIRLGLSKRIALLKRLASEEQEVAA
jgi:hypothetical protein